MESGLQGYQHINVLCKIKSMDSMIHNYGIRDNIIIMCDVTRNKVERGNFGHMRNSGQRRSKAKSIEQ